MAKTLFGSRKISARRVWKNVKKGFEKFGVCFNGKFPDSRLNTLRASPVRQSSSLPAVDIHRPADVQDRDQSVVSDHAEEALCCTQRSQAEVNAAAEAVDEVFLAGAATKAGLPLENVHEPKSSEEASLSLTLGLFSESELGENAKDNLHKDLRMSCKEEEMTQKFICLRQLLPEGEDVIGDRVALLDEVISYIKLLEAKVQLLQQQSSTKSSREENRPLKLKHSIGVCEFGGLKPVFYNQQNINDLSQNDGKIGGSLSMNGLSQGCRHDSSSLITKSDSCQIVPCSEERTLPHGFRGQWQPASDGTKVHSIYSSGVHMVKNIYSSLLWCLMLIVQCWNHINFRAIKISSNLLEPYEEKLSSEIEMSALDSTLCMDKSECFVHTDNFNAEVVSDSPATSLQHIIKEPCPPPVLADVRSLVLRSPNDSNPGRMKSFQDELCSTKHTIQLHMSAQVMETFMRVANSNTKRCLETCGILCGLLKNRKLYVTALVIPKQEATPNSCETRNEEELQAVQYERSLLTLGWIHTHPTQSCFMSSIDVHTHYSYQALLPEAIAIVMAPTDTARKHGIFRLSPGGMREIRDCKRSGFHPHREPPDGRPIYELGTDVYMNSRVQFDVIDLR